MVYENKTFFKVNTFNDHQKIIFKTPHIQWNQTQMYNTYELHGSDNELIEYKHQYFIFHIRIYNLIFLFQLVFQ